MPQKIIIVAETTHAEYPEMHRDDIQLRRREKHSCKGWVDRWYLPPIPYDDIAENKIVDDGLDLFDYKLTNRPYKRSEDGVVELETSNGVGEFLHPQV